MGTKVEREREVTLFLPFPSLPSSPLSLIINSNIPQWTRAAGGEASKGKLKNLSVTGMQWFQALIPVPVTTRICSVDFLFPDARKLRVDINSDLLINACEW